MRVGHLAGVLLPAVLCAQDPQPQPVFRLSVDLAQIDAVVTDDSGRHITDLTKDEVVVKQDGHRYPVTTLTYFDARSPRVEQATGRRERRTIAAVIDDASVSFESLVYVRKALLQMVDQLDDGDRLAIERTGGQDERTVDFTDDKRRLRETVMSLRWHAQYARAREDDELAAPTSEFAALQETIFTNGTLGAVNGLIVGMKSLPGRKAVALISSRLSLVIPKLGSQPPELNHVLIEATRRLIDVANRAGVVLYVIDARRLIPRDVSAAARGDYAPGEPPVVAARTTELLRTREGMHRLARDTGGFVVQDENDIGAGLRRVIEDQSGYYVIGYQPPDHTFKPEKNGRPRYRRIEVEVTRKGARVRTRAAFYGRATEP